MASLLHHRPTQIKIQVASLDIRMQQHDLKRKRSLGSAVQPIELSDSETESEDGYDTATEVEEINHFRHASISPDEWSLAECIKRVLEAWPDISIAFVTELAGTASRTGNSALERYQEVFEHISDLTTYPKEKDEKLKTVREAKLPPEIDLEVFRRTKEYQRLASKLLESEFGTVPSTYIKGVFRHHGHIQAAYHEIRNALDMRKKPFRQAKSARVPIDDSPQRLAMFDPQARAVHEELKTVRQEWFITREKSMQHERVAQAEKDNEAEARRVGLMRECGCCFSEVPLNRMIHCDVDEDHLFCYECSKMHVDTTIGNSRCHPTCMDGSGCNAAFAESALRLCIEEKTLQRLYRLQQQDSLRQANIAGLTDCPFCDYMGICADVALDREFRCENPECRKISCRHCQLETHVPLTCEEERVRRERDNKLDARHVVEEAMTQALVRTCNKCKTKFVKEAGCNKMTCPQCHNHQCYMCHENIASYDHFSRPGGCTADDGPGLEIRHQEEVKRAAEAATAKLIAEKPDIEEKDLEISVSEEVRKAEEAARRTNLGFPPGQLGFMNGFVAPLPPELPLEPFLEPAARLNEGDAHLLGMLHQINGEPDDELWEDVFWRERRQAEFHVRRIAREMRPGIRAVQPRPPPQPPTFEEAILRDPVNARVMARDQFQLAQQAGNAGVAPPRRLGQGLWLNHNDPPIVPPNIDHPRRQDGTTRRHQDHVNENERPPAYEPMVRQPPPPAPWPYVFPNIPGFFNPAWAHAPGPMTVPPPPEPHPARLPMTSPHYGFGRLGNPAPTFQAQATTPGNHRLVQTAARSRLR